MAVGTCKDRLADAIDRFGRVPIVKRNVVVPPGYLAAGVEREPPYWAAGGLIHDGAGSVVLVRHAAPSHWGDAWVTPGGLLELGETTLHGLFREVREEVGLDLVAPRLTRIFNETLTDGVRVRHGYFAQFVARAASADVDRGPGVSEARWFTRLPESMAFRQDYVEDFLLVGGARF